MKYSMALVRLFATRREDANVSVPRMCHWMTRKWHKNHSPSLNDVTTAFSSVRWKSCYLCTIFRGISMFQMNGSYTTHVGVDEPLTEGMIVSLDMTARVEDTPSTESSGGFDGAQVKEDQPEGTTRLDLDLAKFVAPTLEKRMEIFIQRSWARIKMEIGHLGAGEKKRGFITAYQKGWFLDIATLGHVDECLQGLLELQKAYPYIFRAEVALMDLISSSWLCMPSVKAGRPT
ncbi:acetyl-CoA carboxylase 2 [Dorcoceras hygrometricum]|uniref:Acetyl-CoA carboxylase 2 n=1 Tax=Dorcoceras hygrometricum TaxID=472368 RepID=A0A2Z7DKL7_9LAMI|nr:acetyl-CoA carboxylase 2 [Dorcoceras hygrometricum]